MYTVFNVLIIKNPTESFCSLSVYRHLYSSLSDFFDTVLIFSYGAGKRVYQKWDNCDLSFQPIWHTESDDASGFGGGASITNNKHHHFQICTVTYWPQILCLIGLTPSQHYFWWCCNFKRGPIDQARFINQAHYINQARKAQKACLIDKSEFKNGQKACLVDKTCSFAMKKW